MSTAPLRHAIVHSPLLFLDDCGALPRSVAVVQHTAPRPGPAGWAQRGGRRARRGSGASERVVGKISVGRGAKGSEGSTLVHPRHQNTNRGPHYREAPQPAPPLDPTPALPSSRPPTLPTLPLRRYIYFIVSCPASKHINISNSFPRRRGFIWFGHRTCPPTPTVESRVGKGRDGQCLLSTSKRSRRIFVARNLI